MASNKFKKGAASFYIVAFSTLILMVIAASFTAVVLSEMARTENDDLSQSAYDAALAGVEDAKLAYYNYQKCLGASEKVPDEDGKVDCGEIVYWVNRPDCDMVGKILGRNEGRGGEVLIEEVSTSSGGVTNNMQQAYTCVQIDTSLSDYRSTLTESDTMRVVRVRLGNKPGGSDKIKASEIKKVKISWFSNSDIRAINANNVFKFTNFNENKVKFPALRSSGVDMAVPPMISVGLVQTGGNSFNLDDFTETSSGQTNRGMVYLVPVGTTKTDVDEINKVKNLVKKYGEIADSNDEPGNYVGAYYGESVGNKITSDWIVKSNDRNVKNLPFGVYCPGLTEGEEFACSATLELPEAIGGGRNDDTFMFIVSIPYGRPNTEFALEFFCAEGTACGPKITSTTGGSGGTVEENNNQAVLGGMQVKIDSTGRANNLYRRVEVRLEGSDAYFPFPLYAIELLGNSDSNGLLQKPDVVTCEWGQGNGIGWSGFGITGPCPDI